MQKQAMIEERRPEELMMKERARLKMEEERREHELMLARQKEEEEFRIKQEISRVVSASNPVSQLNELA
jgi:hypothetical protein